MWAEMRQDKAEVSGASITSPVRHASLPCLCSPVSSCIQSFTGPKNEPVHGHVAVDDDDVEQGHLCRCHISYGKMMSVAYDHSVTHIFC